MSKEAATAFLKAISDKPEFREQLHTQRLDEHQTLGGQKKLLDFVARAGYSFTTEELTAALVGWRLKAGELSEEQLETVAGGTAVEYGLQVLAVFILAAGK